MTGSYIVENSGEILGCTRERGTVRGIPETIRRRKMFQKNSSEKHGRFLKEFPGNRPRNLSKHLWKNRWGLFRRILGKTIDDF